MFGLIRLSERRGSNSMKVYKWRGTMLSRGGRNKWMSNREQLAPVAPDHNSRLLEGLLPRTSSTRTPWVRGWRSGGIHHFTRDVPRSDAILAAVPTRTHTKSTRCSCFLKKLQVSLGKLRDPDRTSACSFPPTSHDSLFLLKWWMILYAAINWLHFIGHLTFRLSSADTLLVYHYHYTSYRV